MKKVAISAVLLFGSSLPTLAGEPSAEQRREIEGIIQKWADAFNQGDYKQQVSYATNDIEAVGPWGVWIGKEYNLQMTEKTYTNLRGKLSEMKTEAITAHDPKAIFVTTSYVFEIPNAPQAKGTWFQVFEQQGDGTWKMSHNIVARRTSTVPTQAPSK
jgi:ketosteroid isomerase-like protein